MITNVNQGMGYLRNLTEIDQVVMLGHNPRSQRRWCYDGCIPERRRERCLCLPGVREDLPLLWCNRRPPACRRTYLCANYGLNNGSVKSKPSDHRRVIRLQAQPIFEPLRTSQWLCEQISLKLHHRIQEELLDRCSPGNGIYTDDEPSAIIDTLYTGFSNKSFAQDTRYLTHTTHAWSLLHKNGTTRQVVPAVRVPSNFNNLAQDWQDGALKTIIKRYLSTFAIRVNRISHTELMDSMALIMPPSSWPLLLLLRVPPFLFSIWVTLVIGSI